MTFNDFVQTYILHIRAHLKPRTVEQYSGILRHIWFRDSANVNLPISGEFM